MYPASPQVSRPEPSRPRISVVVSSFERPVALRRLLIALAGQSLAPEVYEVIVVDNGSGPATAAVLSEAAATLGARLVPLRLAENRGPAGGRNAGWGAARGRWVAFTDDDCVPAAGWLERLLAVADGEGDDTVILQGRTNPDPDGLRARSSTLGARIVSVQAADGRFETCNILYPRALLQRLHGFDETFGPRGLAARPVGEDTDLGWRALALGARVRFVPEAVVLHEVVHLGPMASVAAQTRWAGAAHLFKVHPQARTILFRHVFWNVWHYMLAQALLSLLGPRWLRRLILGRYLRAMRARARECGAGAWAVPYLIASDAIEFAVIAGAAVAERTVLL
ncbi:glycosyltransferase family 2 protein [Conexibacter sp. DBS9H8]|uniref:glycosyltransferase family 2 protein n=1 Tax=Conexibacter sp. DBS9H8 TaxID=2937801 RepID=UPI00200BD93E|nr:glycosyltransferase [Conexibacter sp. DBS9H8]